MSRILCIIPARYASSRFPGKPLVDIGGKTMIERVYRQVTASDAGKYTYVATDDQRIFDHVAGFGGNVVMTSAQHNTGTERCAEAFSIISRESGMQFDLVLNVQGDEPFINPSQVDLLATCLHFPGFQIATLIRPVTDPELLHQPSIVKVVTNLKGEALLFSRSCIPFQRDATQTGWVKQNTYFQHIGIYAWTPDVLSVIALLPPAPLEQAEKLEQLRWLEHGYRINTIITHESSIAIDTPDDLSKLTNTP